MSGLFGVLDMASRSLMVTQRGVGVAGHNIANVNTPGYSRQRQILGTSEPAQARGGNIGTGVQQEGIERSHDAFLEGQLRDQGSSAAATDAQAKALSVVEQVLNEQGGEGLSAGLSELYSTFSDVAASPVPGQAVEREALRSAARSLVDLIHGSDTRLREIQASSDQQIRRSLPEINGISERIHELNGRIASQEIMAPANDLRDRRDVLVRELAEKLEIQTYERDTGQLEVSVAGGLTLVSTNQVNRLQAIPDPANPFNPSFARVEWTDGGTSQDVTDDIGSGELGGLLRVRDTILPAAIRSLDTVAYNLTASVNAVHAGGTGLDGSTGDFFLALPAVEDAARDVALDPAILASTDAIAAGLSTAPGDNRNAMALAALESAQAPLFLPGDPPGPASGPSRSVLEQAAALVGDVGQQARSLTLSREQQQRVLEQLEDRRDEVSGVSIDEEVTQLIQLQAAFQANARIIGVVQQMLDDLVNSI